MVVQGDEILEALIRARTDVGPVLSGGGGGGAAGVCADSGVR